MATKEDLYVSVSPNLYKSNKSAILTSQADLLGTLKKLHKLTILARQKHDLKKRLHKLFESTNSEIESIQKKVPTPKVPKTVHREEEPEKIETKKDLSKIESIDEELSQIQEKLRELNG